MQPDNHISRLFEDIYGKSRRTAEKRKQVEAGIDV